MKHTISDAGDLRKYFAAIPNIVFTLGLNAYELALYAHFKQAAGDKGGVCWKSRATIAKEAGMSAGMVTKVRLSLEKPRSELGGLSLIHSKEEPSKVGGSPTHHTTITDIWPINMGRYAPSLHDAANTPASLSVSTASPHDGTPSPGDHKEELLKKNSEEKPKELIPPFVGHDFLIALADWEEHKKEIGKPLKPTGRKQLYRQLGELGESRAVAAMQYSIAHGWQGVFESKENGNGNGANHQRPVNASDRRNEALKKNLAFIAKLRSESGGDTDESVGGKLVNFGGR